jgi:hypothetical protein
VVAGSCGCLCGCVMRLFWASGQPPMSGSEGSAAAAAGSRGCLRQWLRALAALDTSATSAGCGAAPPTLVWTRGLFHAVARPATVPT